MQQRHGNLFSLNPNLLPCCVFVSSSRRQEHTKCISHYHSMKKKRLFLSLSTLSLCSPLNILSEHVFPTTNMSWMEGGLRKEIEHEKCWRKYLWQYFCTDLELPSAHTKGNIHNWLVKLCKGTIPFPSAGLLPGLSYICSLQTTKIVL